MKLPLWKSSQNGARNTIQALHGARVLIKKHATIAAMHQLLEKLQKRKKKPRLLLSRKPRPQKKPKQENKILCSVNSLKSRFHNGTFFVCDRYRILDSRSMIQASTL